MFQIRQRATCAPLRLIFSTLRPQSRLLTISRPLLKATSVGGAPANRPTTAPKPAINIKDIRERPIEYSSNALARNCTPQSAFPAKIVELHQQCVALQREARKVREANNVLKGLIANPMSTRERDAAKELGFENFSREQLIEKGKEFKVQLSKIEEREEPLLKSIDEMAVQMPNFSSPTSPEGQEAKVIELIGGDHPEKGDTTDRVWKSHVHIGLECEVLDFASAAQSSGWGWYYLLNEGAMLEQALVQYAISKAMAKGWKFVSPPSIVYSHAASACGFLPRDTNGETQVYTLSQSEEDKARGVPEMSLAGTAEIPLAAMGANRVFAPSELPMRHVAVSRCYRAEAGARGVDTKGLYRVHEFTKVELFSFTSPDLEETTKTFESIVEMQKEILSELGLHARVLEMPTTDLGASAYRKIDIEAFFPSRRDRDEGYGEVTSTSICTDYQARRLNSVVKSKVGRQFVYTVNGTGMAVPRVLACILENGWEEERRVVRVPECLWPWMGGVKEIKAKVSAMVDYV